MKIYIKNRFYKNKEKHIHKKKNIWSKNYMQKEIFILKM